MSGDSRFVAPHNQCQSKLLSKIGRKAPVFGTALPYHPNQGKTLQQMSSLQRREARMAIIVSNMSRYSPKQTRYLLVTIQHK